MKSKERASQGNPQKVKGGKTTGLDNRGGRADWKETCGVEIKRQENKERGVTMKVRMEWKSKKKSR